MSPKATRTLLLALLSWFAIVPPPAAASGLPDAARPKRQQVVKDAAGNWTFPQVARIVGGRKATEGEVPWQVALIVTDLQDDSAQYLCGGSIIQNGWILTAAHCVEGYEASANKVLSISGKLNINDAAATQEVATRVIVHPLYCNGTQDYDVALVKAKTTGTAIALTTAAPAPKTLAFVSGWGATSENGNSALELQIAAVQIKSAAACNDPAAYDGHISDKMVCAGPRDPAPGQPQRPADSCQGDSGGPLFAAGNSKAQFGIVSWGEGCARPGKFGVYSDVSSLQKWINDHAQ